MWRTSRSPPSSPEAHACGALGRAGALLTHLVGCLVHLVGGSVGNVLASLLGTVGQVSGTILQGQDQGLVCESARCWRAPAGWVSTAQQCHNSGIARQLEDCAWLAR